MRAVDGAIQVNQILASYRLPCSILATFRESAVSLAAPFGKYRDAFLTGLWDQGSPLFVPRRKGSPKSRPVLLRNARAGFAGDMKRASLYFSFLRVLSDVDCIGWWVSV